MQMNAEKVAINLRHSYPPSFVGEYANGVDLRKELWDRERHEKQ